MTVERPAVICLMGPTASGKTDVALELAARLPVEIVSVDSAMVYRGMDIGTAKPDAATRQQFPHHLIDIRDPADPYSAAAFRSDVVKLVTEIHQRGRVPLLAGGTMLYFRSLKDGLAELPSADPVVRARIQAMADAEGWPAVHRRLAEVDRKSAERINPNDPQRLQRALEIFEISGRSMSSLHEAAVDECPFSLHEFAIIPPDRAALHEAIAGRFRQMLRQGFVEEVAALRDRLDLDPTLPSIRAVGYRQVWAYLDGEFPEEVMVERGIIATRQLAKRQYTWLRSWKDLVALSSPDISVILKNPRLASILEFRSA